MSNVGRNVQYRYGSGAAIAGDYIYAGVVLVDYEGAVTLLTWTADGTTSIVTNVAEDDTGTTVNTYRYV